MTSRASIAKLSYNPAGAMLSETGLAAAGLAALAPRVEQARKEVLDDLKLWHGGGPVPAEKDPLDAIKLMMRAIFGAYLTKAAEEKRRLSLITWSEALFDEAVFASARDGMREPRKALVAMLKHGQQTGAVRKNVDAEAMASAMVSMFQGLLLHKIWDPAMSLPAVTEACDQLLEGLRA